MNYFTASIYPPCLVDLAPGRTESACVPGGELEISETLLLFFPLISYFYALRIWRGRDVWSARSGEVLQVSFSNSVFVGPREHYVWKELRPNVVLSCVFAVSEVRTWASVTVWVWAKVNQEGVYGGLGPGVQTKEGQIVVVRLQAFASLSAVLVVPVIMLRSVARSKRSRIS